MKKLKLRGDTGEKILCARCSRLNKNGLMYSNA